MELLKKQNFTVKGQDCCATIYGYQMPNRPEDLYAVSIVGVSEHSEKTLFVNRAIRTRAKAEKIFNSEVDKIKS